MRQRISIEACLILVAIVGVLAATLLVACGWILDLQAQGGQLIPADLMQTDKSIIRYHFNFAQLSTLNASNLIILGILALILSQISRVIILTIFYWIRKDVSYFFICAFILLMLSVNLFLKV